MAFENLLIQDKDRIRYIIISRESKLNALNQATLAELHTALQEDVDAIGISILSGAHMTVFPKIIKLVKEKGMDDVLITGGGIIPMEDMEALKKLGVGELFPPGTTTKDIVTYITGWVHEHRNF